MPIRRTTRIGHATGLPIHDGELAIGGYSGLPIVPSGSKTYESYIESLGPLLWLAMTGTGATEVNKGTVGATLDGTITNMGAQGIAGKIADDSAHLYNASNSQISVPNDISIQPDALGAFTWVAITMPFSQGEGTLGRLAQMPVGNAYDWRINGHDQRIYMQLEAATTDAQRSVQFTSRFIGKWTVFFMSFDVATDLLPSMFRYDNDGFEEAVTVGGSQNISGALSTPSGNIRVGYAGQLDGIYDEFMIFGSVLSASQMERIGRLALARRWNSYLKKLLEVA